MAGKTTQAAPEQAPAPDEKADRESGLRKAYSLATTRLREEFRTDFDRLYSEEAEKLGLTYTPKPTPEQKAKADLEKLLAEYPHLKDELVSSNTTPETTEPSA